MIVNIAGKDKRRKCVALLVCLFVAANSVQGTVLCFGADGHIEFESAFHEQCTDTIIPCPQIIPAILKPITKATDIATVARVSTFQLTLVWPKF